MTTLRHHCPLKDLVAVSKVSCRFEQLLMEELLGEALIRETFMPDGNHSCAYSIAGAPREQQRRRSRRVAGKPVR